MRKLRRLPWRIPKSHNSQPSAAPAEVCPRVEAEIEARREAMRESLNAQPVAFAGGRYVYDAPKAKVARPAEIRLKVRHRAILPIPVAG